MRARVGSWGRLLAVWVVCAAPRIAHAHEMRPSLLEVEPRDDGKFDVRFKIGFARNQPMELDARLPEHCTALQAPLVLDTPPVRTLRWVVDCKAAGLTGEISVEGLGESGTDVIVRVPAGVVVLRPNAPAAVLPGTSSEQGGSVLGAYIGIGIEHILLGPDHLLFVLGLVFLVGRRWRALLSTITAFTVAHSLTLAMSTLELVRLPTRAVEAVIAASIVVLAHELVRPRVAGWSTRMPWLFALVCGLMHGFGFAGVLAEVGLPSEAIPTALFGFNVGVELGQLAFVGVLLLIGTLIRRFDPRQTSSVSVRGPALTAYLVGTVGAYWVWERAAPILVDAWGLA